MSHERINKNTALNFKIFGIIYGINFIVIAVSFMTIGLKFWRKLKEVSPISAAKLKTRVFSSIIIIFTTFMIRGVSIILCFIFISESVYTQKWLREDSLTPLILLLILYVIIDGVPTVYLCLGVKWVTEEFKRTQSMSINDRQSVGQLSGLDSDLNESVVKEYVESDW